MVGIEHDSLGLYNKKGGIINDSFFADLLLFTAQLYLYVAFCILYFVFV